jgi:hypothetical protein
VLLEGLEKLKNPMTWPHRESKLGRLAAQRHIYMLLGFKAMYFSPHFRWVRLQLKTLFIPGEHYLFTKFKQTVHME